MVHTISDTTLEDGAITAETFYLGRSVGYGNKITWDPEIGP